MKKYFVTGDIHSFYSIFKAHLEESDFNIYNQNHILIICGDIFDRGNESKELLDFLLSIPQDRLILIRGNHEDLMQDCLNQLKHKSSVSYHHISNGTLDTISQLTKINKYDLMCGIFNYKKDIENKLKDYFRLISNCINYYELKDYIFVHGWVPQVRLYEDLAKCTDEDWKKARWNNGMELWHNGWKFEGKTIVCGHWHTSFGNFNYHHKGSGEFDKHSDFGIFEDDGIIAVDACTAFSGKLNIKVLEI